MPECAKRVSRKERGALARLGGLRARSVPFANCIREPLANFPTVVEVANCGVLASGPSSILVVIQATLYLSYMSLDAVRFGRAAGIVKHSLFGGDNEDRLRGLAFDAML